MKTIKRRLINVDKLLEELERNGYHNVRNTINSQPIIEIEEGNKMKEESCFDCKHRNIMETSHEWIENFCKLDGHKCSPFDGCSKYEYDENYK